MEQKQLSLENMNKEIVALKHEIAKIKAMFEEDLEFARRTEEAWESHDKGEFTSYSKDEFLKKLKEW